MLLEELRKGIRVKIHSDFRIIDGLTGKVSHWFPQSSQLNPNGRCPHGKFREYHVAILTDKNYPDPNAHNKTKCERCQGEKFVGNEPCFKCNGQGFVTTPIMRDRTVCCLHELEKLHIQDVKLEKENEPEPKNIEEAPDNNGNGLSIAENDPWADFPGGRPF